MKKWVPALMGYGEIGRHRGFKIPRVIACRFESDYPNQLRIIMDIAETVLDCTLNDFKIITNDPKYYYDTHITIPFENNIYIEVTFYDYRYHISSLSEFTRFEVTICTSYETVLEIMFHPDGTMSREYFDDEGNYITEKFEFDISELSEELYFQMSLVHRRFPTYKSLQILFELRELFMTKRNELAP